MIIIQHGDDAVATGDMTSASEMKDIKGLPEVVLFLYYFSSIKLAPKIVFKHLAGIPLKSWLDEANLVVSGTTEFVGPLRYIHGRSEAIKGRTSVSAVLLARLDRPIPEAAWMAAIPGIYGRFTRTLDTGLNKNA